MAAATVPANGVLVLGAECPDPGLAGLWQRLEPRAGLPTQAQGYAMALAATLLAGTPLGLVMVEGAEGIEALLPLCLAGGPLARLRLAGPRETSEPGDALCRDAAAAAGLAQRLAALGRPLALDRIPADSPLVPAIRAAMHGHGLVSVRPAQPCPALLLGPDWCDPESRFNSGRRSDFRRARRKAEALGAVTFELVCPDPAEFDARFDEAVRIETSGWKDKAGTALSADPAKQAFFREYLRSECRLGRLRIGMMRIDGRSVAMQLAVELDGRLWLYKIGYDAAFRQCSPGTLLLLNTIAVAARAGLASVEFMGNPEAWITELWSRTERPCVRLRTYPFTLAGLAALIADGCEWLRARLPGARA